MIFFILIFFKIDFWLLEKKNIVKMIFFATEGAVNLFSENL